MQRFFSSIISYLVLASALAACGSNVKLQDVPVEDRSASSSQADADAAAAAAAAARGVVPLQIGASDASGAGPANTARIVYFDFDSFVVKPEFQSVIEAHARYLTANKSRRMAIEGHTDESGGREYNLALGQKRAEAVRRALGLLGVTDSQAEAVSFGKEKPAAGGFDQESMSRNRRAELNYR
ncbi:18K peptidoglycan-associated outer membrane lipoprotein; Peptidoglycan-associated lipoprotein precursor; Outer membrane protein P6; OmpA/MotB precursor [Polaromonas sp. CG9_12]|nr:18K peptidoglycan-associated outer membrane lipoprotein; Peptidoglycan-associated lipoprotein precursor; Outer membrane protein P6; OmpA/MotB precursor [Polaromonas sp. CG9_12]